MSAPMPSPPGATPGERLAAIRARVEAASAAPWDDRFLYLEGSVNDHTHPAWTHRAKDIAVGACCFCDNPDGQFVRAYTDAGGDNFHVHRFEPDGEEPWLRVFSSHGPEIARVRSTLQDTAFIAHAREDVPWLLERVATLEAGIRLISVTVGVSSRWQDSMIVGMCDGLLEPEPTA